MTLLSDPRAWASQDEPLDHGAERLVRAIAMLGNRPVVARCRLDVGWFVTADQQVWRFVAD